MSLLFIQTSISETLPLVSLNNRCFPQILLKQGSTKRLLKSSPTAIYILYKIMLHIDRNVDKNYRLSIFHRSWVNPSFPLALRADWLSEL